MSLFADPLVLNDGAVARTFNYRAQVLQPDAIIGEYIEPAASAAASSTLAVKHTTSKNGRKRHALQRVENLTINDADGTLSPLVVTVTVSRDPGHLDAQVQKQVTLVIDAMSEAGFVAGWTRERI